MLLSVKNYMKKYILQDDTMKERENLKKNKKE